MSAKKTLFVVLVASLVVLAVAVGPRIAETARALPPPSKQTSAGVTIPYRGHLADEAGGPVAEGVYDFTFALYEAETGGEPLWSEVQEGVMVKDGTFVTSLGSVNTLPAEVLNDSGCWLAVGVRGPGESDFAALNPRQHLSAAAPASPASPASGVACPHDHFGETWSGAGTGLSLDLTSGTGLVASVDSGTGVLGEATGSSGVGVVARNDAATGTALSIFKGALQVKDAGLDTSTPVFIHEVRMTGDDANLCTKGTWHQYYSTVVDHPLANGNPNAVLFVTPNYGLASSEHVGPAHAPYGVYYDDRNQCGFGDRWIIYAYDGTTLNDGQMFNVLVVVP
jgi:hypothetical protein